MEFESLQQEVQHMIEEARMVLPGIQALFGFQLIAVFNAGFQDLTEGEQILHYAALVLVAVAIGLIMAPAAYHRMAEPGRVTRFFVDLGSTWIAWAMLPLTVALAAEVFIVGLLVIENEWVSGALALMLFCLLLVLWFVYPLQRRAMNTLVETDEEAVGKRR